MKKVSLCTSPHLHHPSLLTTDFQPQDGAVYTFGSVGLLSLFAVLREKRQYSPLLFDVNRQIKSGNVRLDENIYNDVAELILADKPDIVGFMTECDSYHHVLQFCDAIRGKSPSVYIVLGGPQASVVAKETLESFDSVDAIVCGEAEKSFHELLLALDSHTPTAVKGTVRRMANGMILDGGAADLIENLDSLPIPAYDIYTPDPGEEFYLDVGRGCPFPCTFCSTAPYWRRKHRVKSPERILREILLLCKLHGVNRVHFTHDLFTANREWAKAVCHTLIEAGRPVTWTCSARTDTLDDELINSMANAGCSAVYLGIESGSARILKSVGKDIPWTTSLNAIRSLQAKGISVTSGFIIGTRFENRQSVRETFQAFTEALENGSRPTHLFGYCPFKGSSEFASLTDLTFIGHFLDLPLGDELALKNRALLEQNPLLFSSYFRSAGVLENLPAGELDAIDEFSTLVETAMLPAFAVSQCLGGMYELYSRWVSWIGLANTNVPNWRRYYGTPQQFALFCMQELEAVDDLHHVQAFTKLKNIEANFVKNTLSLASAKSQNLSTSQTLSFQGRIIANGILALFHTEYCMTELMNWSPVSKVPEKNYEDTFLLWQRWENKIQLISIDLTTYDLVKCVIDGYKTVGEIMLQWTINPPTYWDGSLEFIYENARIAMERELIVMME